LKVPKQNKGHCFLLTENNSYVCRQHNGRNWSTTLPSWIQLFRLFYFLYILANPHFNFNFIEKKCFCAIIFLDEGLEEMLNGRVADTKKRSSTRNTSNQVIVNISVFFFLHSLSLSFSTKQ